MDNGIGLLARGAVLGHRTLRQQTRQLALGHRRGRKPGGRVQISTGHAVNRELDGKPRPGVQVATPLVPYGEPGHKRKGYGRSDKHVLKPVGRRDERQEHRQQSDHRRHRTPRSKPPLVLGVRVVPNTGRFGSGVDVAIQSGRGVVQLGRQREAGVRAAASRLVGGRRSTHRCGIA